MFNDFALVDNIGCVTCTKCFPNVMVRDYNAKAPLFQLSDNLLDIVYGERSIPANGSSSSMNLGSVIRALDISNLRRSPPEREFAF